MHVVEDEEAVAHAFVDESGHCRIVAPWECLSQRPSEREERHPCQVRERATLEYLSSAGPSGLSEKRGLPDASCSDQGDAAVAGDPFTQQRELPLPSYEHGTLPRPIGRGACEDDGFRVRADPERGASRGQPPVSRPSREIEPPRRDGD